MFRCSSRQALKRANPTRPRLRLSSAAFYLFNGKFDFWQALPYLPFGLVGAVVGAKLLPKIPNKLLKRIFGGVMVLSAIRLLLR